MLTIFIFGLLVLFHEFGHFLLAKKNGITVVEFSLGLGPRLISRQIGETRYSLKALPFGGSCAMLGEDDPDDFKEGAFAGKNVWQRMSVVLAGPVFNFIIAFLLCLVLVGVFGYDAPVVNETIEGYPAEEAGILPGDEIIRIGHRSVRLWRDISLYNLTTDGRPAEITLLRDGEKITTTLTPKKEGNVYYLGIRSSGGYTRTGFFKTIPYGWYELRYNFRSVFESLKMLITGKAGLRDMTGVVGIYGFVDDVYEETVTISAKAVFGSLTSLAVLLSVSLGIMNLLPLPALDGGRFLFMVIEAIRGKRVDPEIEGKIHFAGLMALLALSVLVMINDIRFHL